MHPSDEKAGGSDEPKPAPTPTPETPVVPDDMASLIKRFNDAIELIKKTIGNNKDHPKYFELDALYNQAITGDINYKRPNRVTMIWSDTRKWDAWNAIKGMPKEIAMRKYISLAQTVSNQSVLLMLLI